MTSLYHHDMSCEVQESIDSCMKQVAEIKEEFQNSYDVIAK